MLEHAQLPLCSSTVYFLESVGMWMLECQSRTGKVEVRTVSGALQRLFESVAAAPIHRITMVGLPETLSLGQI